LQTKLETAKTELQRRESQYAELQAAHGTLITTLETNEENLKRSTEEIAQLRTDMRAAQQARDEKFNEVVQLTDRLNELEGMRKDLEERRVQFDRAGFGFSA